MKSIVLSGGKGTRLFPISRGKYPKQYLKVLNSKSLFQMTVERAEKIGEVVVITNEDQKFIVRDQLNEIGVEADIVIEPKSKNTFAAVVLASIIAEGDFVVFPSDHYIDGNLCDYIKTSKDFVKEYIITFGVKPTKPHTGYGYIKPGERVGEIYKVKEFTEKPDLDTAKKYLSEGYLWNSGIFAMSSKLLKNEVEKFYSGLYNLFESNINKGYEECPETSFDYAIMEKTDKAAVIPLNLTWSDMGNFDSIYEIMEKDENLNAARGETIMLDSSKNLILSTAERLIATIGIEDLLIADTKDVLLVCKKGVSEKVKELTKILKERKDERAEYHTEVHRPWGSYVLLEKGKNYWIKRLILNPKEKISLQRHMHRSEHWIIVRGMAKVTVDDKEYFLRPGESTFVPSGIKHRLENPGKIPAEIIEVAIGEYLEEDDIERFDDVYGR